jgi:phosphotransferase system HPr (HPr) family protein
MQRECIVLNPLGLHARPAAEFVRKVLSFSSTITIQKGTQSYSAASILEVLSANLDCGAAFTLHAEGPDAEEALELLAALLPKFKADEEAEGH